MNDNRAWFTSPISGNGKSKARTVETLNKSEREEHTRLLDVSKTRTKKKKISLKMLRALRKNIKKAQKMRWAKKNGTR